MAADAPLPSGSPKTWRGFWLAYNDVPQMRRSTGSPELIDTTEDLGPDCHHMPVAVVLCPPDSLVLVLTKDGDPSDDVIEAGVKAAHDVGLHFKTPDLGYAVMQVALRAAFAKLRAAQEESRHG